MNKLPSNPNILLSLVNTKLRDFYSSLDSLCDDLDENIDEINEILNSIDYIYSEELNKFISKKY